MLQRLLARLNMISLGNCLERNGHATNTGHATNIGHATYTGHATATHTAHAIKKAKGVQKCVQQNRGATMAEIFFGGRVSDSCYLYHGRNCLLSSHLWRMSTYFYQISTPLSIPVCFLLNNTLSLSVGTLRLKTNKELQNYGEIRPL